VPRFLALQNPLDNMRPACFTRSMQMELIAGIVVATIVLMVAQLIDVVLPK
jgi:hypothetical protein